MQVINRWIISLSDWIAATKGMFDMNLTATRLLRNIHVCRTALVEVREEVAQITKQKSHSAKVDDKYLVQKSHSPMTEVEGVAGDKAPDPLYHSSVQFEMVGLFDLLHCSMKRAFDIPMTPVRNIDLRSPYSLLLFPSVLGAVADLNMRLLVAFNAIIYTH